MTKEERKKLLTHSKVFERLLVILEKSSGSWAIDKATAKVIQESLEAVKADFPKLVPEFDMQNAYSNGYFYRKEPFRVYLSRVLGILEAHLEEDSQHAFESLTFPFVHDPEIRKIIERDYIEMQKALGAECWKSVIILSGGSIEAILTDSLSSNEEAAKNAHSAPKESDLSKWHLKKLIEVAVELNLISEGVSRLSHSVREYRNLVHPGNELRNNLHFEKSEALIAIEVLKMLHRDLSTTTQVKP